MFGLSVANRLSKRRMSSRKLYWSLYSWREEQKRGEKSQKPPILFKEVLVSSSMWLSIEVKSDVWSEEHIQHMHQNNDNDDRLESTGLGSASVPVLC